MKERIEEHIDFIKAHASDDLDRLLLSASRYPGIDIPFVVDQLRSRRQIKDKLPSWYQNDRLVFPAKVAAEQCSSEQTALYKQRLVEPQAHVCDLTGGLGIDSYFFSRKVRQVTYIERFPAYCEPDLTKLVSVLFSHAPRVIATLSPMADIRMTLDLLPDVTDIPI